LIHELISHPRAATDPEIRIITDRIANAPFNTAIQKVPAPERDTEYQGITLGPRVDSLTLHLFRRVIGEGQWAVGTTADTYVRCLQRAARVPYARLVLYQQWGDRDLAGVIVPTSSVLDPQQMGPRAEANLFVLYLANSGILVSGYQFSAMNTIRIPGDALWLR